MADGTSSGNACLPVCRSPSAPSRRLVLPHGQPGTTPQYSEQLPPSPDPSPTAPPKNEASTTCSMTNSASLERPVHRRIQQVPRPDREDSTSDRSRKHQSQSGRTPGQRPLYLPLITHRSVPPRVIVSEFRVVQCPTQGSCCNIPTGVTSRHDTRRSTLNTCRLLVLEPALIAAAPLKTRSPATQPKQIMEFCRPRPMESAFTSRRW